MSAKELEWLYNQSVFALFNYFQSFSVEITSKNGPLLLQRSIENQYSVVPILFQSKIQIAAIGLLW